MQSTTRGEEIQYVSFNQDQECFVVGTNFGFKVYNTYPFKEILVRDMGGGIGLVEMLYKTNLLAMVGGGPTPKFPPHKVIIWDDYQGKIIGEMTFKSEIRALKLRQNKVAVVIDNKVYVHNLQDLTVITTVETCFNPKGLFAFSLNEAIMCVPDKVAVGFINIVHLETQKVFTKKAHSTPLSFLEINMKGDLIATASEKGTLIRIFSSADGTLLQELRRGTEQHQILSISFSANSDWLACTSDSGTAHIFSLNRSLENQVKEEKEKETDKKDKNSKSKLSFLKIVHPYFDSEWSYAHIKLQEKRAKVIFLGKEKQVVVISFEGTYYLAAFDAKNGQILEKKTFFTPLN